MSEVDYSKLRLDVLEKMVNSRGIECKMKKDEMGRVLKLYDEGKYVEPLRETTYEKKDDGFLIGIDIKNREHILQISKLVEKKEAHTIGRYEDNRIIYWCKQKLM